VRQHAGRAGEHHQHCQDRRLQDAHCHRRLS
jgi:hypothetical protein